tara:strand:- start:61 stop:483 length:423 start_codon:yes stop_codon:yes gene_type:complete
MKNILIVIVVIIAFGFITRNLVKFEQSLEVKKITEKNKEQRSIFTKFVIKNTIVAGSLVFVIGLKTRDLIQSFLDSVINPFFKDKKSITQITKAFQFTIFGLTFTFTDFVLDLIKYTMFMLFIYIIVIIIYTRTDLISIQ